MIDTAFVKIWGLTAGAVAWNPDRQLGTFEFDPDFPSHGLDLAPLTMPVAGRKIFSFPALPPTTFRGLPGLLADALPDLFGNSIINAWLARQGRTASSFSPVQRLCYTGSRAMGALEFAPALQPGFKAAVPVEISELVRLAQEVVNQRGQLRGKVAPDSSTDALLDIIRVGTSAGGGRPKAVIALNEDTGEVRSGQLSAPAGFKHWLLKFDGVQDSTLGDPAGYGRIELAYHHMATAAGIEMQPCRLLEEGGRAHFMTRRFDRTDTGERRHLQSLCALGHHDFNNPGATSYEQAFQVMGRLHLTYPERRQQFLRMAFNVMARNQDDHTKNIAYLMDRQGQWRLAPAFDVTFAYNPHGNWTDRHQMTVAGKRENITRGDLLEVARLVGVKKADALVDQVREAVARWAEFADEGRVEAVQAERIGNEHLLV